MSDQDSKKMIGTDSGTTKKSWDGFGGMRPQQSGGNSSQSQGGSSSQSQGGSSNQQQGSGDKEKK